jgi:hypothetical protein
MLFKILLRHFRHFFKTIYGEILRAFRENGKDNVIQRNLAVIQRNLAII